MLNRKQFRILVWMVIALLALNISALGTIVWLRVNQPKASFTVCDAPGKYKKHSFRMYDQRISEEVGFDEEQLEQFRSLRETHFQEIREINRKLKETRAVHFQLIHKGEDNSHLLDSLNKRVGELHHQWSGSATKFLLGARQICTPDQIPGLFRVIMESRRDRHSGHRHSKSGRHHSRHHHCSDGHAGSLPECVVD